MRRMMKRTGKMKLFPKTFCYLLVLFGAVILMMNVMLYILLPKVYLNKVNGDLDKNLDSLCGTVSMLSWEECGGVFARYAAGSGVNLTVRSGKEKKVYQGMPIQIDLQEEDAGEKELYLRGVSGVESVLIKNRNAGTRDGRRMQIELSASTHLGREALEVIFYLLPGVSVTAIVISALCAYIYSRKITRPIGKMLQATRSMEALEKDAAAEVDRGDELGMLAEGINSLYCRLLQTIRSLEREKNHISQMERAKVDFLRSASHELKTPLAGLRILLENMYCNVGKYKDHETYLGKGIELVDRLNGMIGDILAASGIQGGSGEMQTVCAAEQVKEVWREYELLAKNRELRTEINISPEAELRMDPVQFRRVCSNLISNAVRYTVKGGRIRIDGSEDALRIRNDCRPLTEEQCSRVFDAFYRPDFARSENDGGSGLGLYLVKEILEARGLPYSFAPDEDGMCFVIGLQDGPYTGLPRGNGKPENRTEHRETGPEEKENFQKQGAVHAAQKKNNAEEK